MRRPIRRASVVNAIRSLPLRILMWMWMSMPMVIHLYWHRRQHNWDVHRCSGARIYVSSRRVATTGECHLTMNSSFLQLKANPTMLALEGAMVAAMVSSILDASYTRLRPWRLPPHRPSLDIIAVSAQHCPRPHPRRQHPTVMSSSP